MHHVPRGAGCIFGPYFWWPFLMAIDVLVLEAALVGRGLRRAVLRASALVAPLGLAALALVDDRPDVAYHRFLALFQAGLGGTPLFWGLVGAAAFHVYALLRRVPGAA